MADISKKRDACSGQTARREKRGQIFVPSTFLFLACPLSQVDPSWYDQPTAWGCFENSNTK